MRWARVLVGVIALLVMVAGCGGDDDSTAQSTTTSASASSSVPPSSGGEGECTLAGTVGSDSFDDVPVERVATGFFVQANGWELAFSTGAGGSGAAGVQASTESRATELIPDGASEFQVWAGDAVVTSDGASASPSLAADLSGVAPLPIDVQITC